jgi:hypothetical protein
MKEARNGNANVKMDVWGDKNGIRNEYLGKFESSASD